MCNHCCPTPWHKTKGFLFSSVVLHQVSIGLHCHPFLTRAQVNSILGLWLAFILRMPPMNLQHQWYLTLLQIPNFVFSKLVSVFYASVLLLMINCIITLSKSLWNPKPQVSGSVHSELQMTLLWQNLCAIKGQMHKNADINFLFTIARPQMVKCQE